MTATITLLGALFAHYRRHPVQGIFLLVGIVVANVLLAGTLLINAQARASYGQGEQLLNASPSGQIRHRESGRPVDETDYILLRRSGFDTVAPLLRQVVRTSTNEAVELLGIDVFAMPRGTAAGDSGQTSELDFTGFAYPPYSLWASPTRLAQLGADEGERLPLLSGSSLPPLTALPDSQLGHRMLIDIGALQELTNQRGRLSSLLVFPTTAEQISRLKDALPHDLVYVSGSDAPDPAELTRSFHLNLAAMGLLAFVVGIFLTYNALAFSYTDRAELIRKLRLAGIARSEMRTALLLELALFLALGLLLGSWLGARLAASLLPGVGQTLAQLYGVYIAYPDSLVPAGFWLPPLMTAAAALLCVLFPLRETLDAPILEQRQSAWQHRNIQRRDRWFAVIGAGLLLAALFTALTLSRTSLGLWPALAGMACLLLGAALLLPMVLRLLLSGLARAVPARNARLSWLVADSRWLLGPASLALMAMTLALVANSGLNTLIGSFRDATEQWLDQRLAADLYLRGDLDPGTLVEGLASEATGLEAGERYRTTVVRPTPRGGRAEIEIVSLRSGARFRDAVRLIDGVDNAAERFRAGEGIYASERAWRLDGWVTGQLIQLCPDRPELQVLGTYHDYGNPRSQWMVSRDRFLECWPEQPPSGLTLSGPDGTDWNRLRALLSERFNFEDGDIIDQREVKVAGLAVFDRTFVVTRALNSLTLIVAGIGIFCAISAIHHHRAGLQAHLASLGLARRERGALLMLQWGLLALLCMVLVWPFGTLLAAYLAGVVTPAAFGWSFPLRVEGSHYIELAVIAVTSLLLAVALPSIRLLRVSTASLLREENL
jgi:putative ABC transport system permease protein